MRGIFNRSMKKIIAICICMNMALGMSGCGSLSEVEDFISNEVATISVASPVEVSSVSEDRYAYSVLSDQEKADYDMILNAILDHEEEVSVYALGEDGIRKVFYAILSDYGNLFYVTGYEYRSYGASDDTGTAVFLPTYTMTYEERLDYQEQVDLKVQEFLSGISADADDYEKSKYVFETLIERVDYNLDAENSQNILSVFLGGETVCQGYADAAAYLLNLLGIQSAVVRGDANGTSHAWNLVRLDGEYYFMDVTWGNSLYLDASSTEGKTVNYGYLNVTSEEMAQTHTLQMEFEVPECVASVDNYYIREGKYFTEVDRQAIGSVFAEAYYGGEAYTSIKCSDAQVYSQMKEFFIDQYGIAEYCRELRTFQYSESESAYILTIFFS